MGIESLGKRIVIVGVSASGKSTFARKLAAKVELPLTHIDAIMWRPGWDYIGDEETVRRLKEISLEDEWIIEGFIEKEAIEALLTRAESIIYLDYARHVAAWRYIQRWLKHRKNARPELAGCPETFSFEFLKRVWDKKEIYRVSKFMKTMPDQQKIVRLSSPGKAEGFLRR